MARALLRLLCGTAAVLLLRASADTARCSRPKAVPNAHIEVGTSTGLHAVLRYSCNPGYKRKAGTSSLIQCILLDGSTRPRWTQPTLQCIRDPALPPQSPIPTIPTAPESTTPKGASPAASPSPAGKPGADGPPPEPSRPVEMFPAPNTSTLAEGTTPLPDTPSDSASVSTPTLASSIGLLVLLVTGIVACWVWKRHARQGYEVTPRDIAMVAPATGNQELPPPGTIPTG